MSCLACGHPEPSRYVQPKGVEYVCSSCVQAFTTKSQTELKDALRAAVADEDHHRAKVLRMFTRLSYEPSAPKQMKKRGRGRGGR